MHSLVNSRRISGRRFSPSVIVHVQSLKEKKTDNLILPLHDLELTVLKFVFVTRLTT